MDTRASRRNIGSIILMVLLLWNVPSRAQAPENVQIMSDSTETVKAIFESEGPALWVPGQVIVKFREDVDVPDVPDIAGLSMSTEASVATSGGERIYTLPLDMSTAALTEDASMQTQQVAQLMSERPEVEYAQVNYIVDIAAEPVDPGYAAQWHYFNHGQNLGQSPGGINMPRAWDVTQGKPEIIVAVIDTGILANHPDIGGGTNLLPGFDMISSAFTANDGDGRDADPEDTGDAIQAGECPPLFVNPPRPNSWHGTHVAGTVGVGRTNNNSGIAGVTWNSKVLPIRVLGKCGGSIGDINDAIRWAAGIAVPGVQSNPNPAHVINMSLRTLAPCSNSPSTQAAINDVLSRGVTVIAAAGNDAQNAANAMPASCNGVVTVAASDNNGNLVTRYSNFGDIVDIMAPGGDVSGSDGLAGGVLSMVQGGYDFYNGTSMAAPHVAGVAALMLSERPNLTPQQVADKLKSSATPRTQQHCPSPCGAGLLNASDAINFGPPTPTISATPANLSIDRGTSAALIAKVVTSGQPVAGQSVKFVSADAAVATVSTATATTNVAGEAQVTVRGVGKGDTQILIESDGGATAIPATVNVAVVPALSAVVFAMLLIFLSLVYYWQFHRRI